MKRICVLKKSVLVAVVYMAFFASLYAQTTDVEKWSIRGDEYYENRDYANAITAYTQVIDLRLKEEDEVEQRARARATNSDFYEFSRTWTGIEIDAYLQRGHSYYRLKNYDAAIADYKVVAENYDPNFYPIYVSLGDAYGAKGDFTNAVSNWKKYIENKPGTKVMSYNVDKSYPADMWFCATLWEKKLLSDDPKYEKWIQEICNNNHVTRAEIETFYKENRGW